MPQLYFPSNELSTNGDKNERHDNSLSVDFCHFTQPFMKEIALKRNEKDQLGETQTYSSLDGLTY